MNTGDIVLVSSQSKQAKIIQKFQCLTDKEAGIYNHSGIILNTGKNVYVVEESQITGYKVKAAAIITPFDHYQKSYYKLKILTPKVPPDYAYFERLMLQYVGIPYDYESLLRGQILRTVLNKWLGLGKKKGWKRMVCHEFVQFVWDQYRAGTFPDYYKGDVSKQFHSEDFV